MSDSTAKRTLFSVALELTRYCNQKCDYCYNAWRAETPPPSAGNDPWPQRVHRLLDAFRLSAVTLTGGEPFAYRGVFDVLALLRDAAVPVRCVSNGGLFDQRLADRLARYAPSFVQVTLNGPDAALHEAHVGHGHFTATLAGVRALRCAGIKVVGCIVVTRKNARRVGDTLALFRELGVDHGVLSRFSPAGYSERHIAALLPGHDDLVCAFEQALAPARAGMRIDCTMPIPPCMIDVSRFAPIGFGSCAIGTPMQEIAVGPDGRVRNCTLHGRAIGDAGDIADPGVDLHALLDHADVVEYRRKVPEFCRGCQHERTCGGGCGAAAEWVLGSRDRGPDPLIGQYVDDALRSRLERERSDGRRRFEIVR